jgi:two-component SAPR family response regulator
MSVARFLDQFSKLNPLASVRFARTLAAAEAVHEPPSVRIRALGGFDVIVDGTPVKQFGGKHAGTRQAQALFAMLFDRGARGVTKDEVIDLIWPESDLGVADLAFHRTLGGLRRVLSPMAPDSVIRHASGRYRLAGGLAISSDVADFEELIASSASATTDERARILESAQRLYAGDYLDDCPYYGDSAAVEDRRVALRELYLHVGRELSAMYRSRGLSTLALLRGVQGRRWLPPEAGWDADLGADAASGPELAEQPA